MFETRALDLTTWPAYADLLERHHGVWNGCWCMGFHEEGPKHHDNRERKEQRVRDGRAHAALVFDGERCVGWCQFGSPDELPRIKHKRAYIEGLTALPDWRITCFFVDREARKQGVAATALAGALELIAQLGGGIVESYPEDAEGRKVSGSFLHNGTLAMFEAQGFERVRQLGKRHWLVSRRA
jgi:GNAT superfamily N-acetyltransferase